jgi:predicted porin
MKKLLLALGLATVFGFAQAQSSVTVYGILDVGYIGTNYTGTGTSATTKQTTSTIGQSAESTSRLGFKGQEDLGGGTSAIFTIETGLNPNNSTLSTFNNRQTFVGLKQNGLGSVTVGTQYTPVFNAISTTDAGMQNNMIGDVIYAANPQTSASVAGTAPYEAASSSSGTVDSITIRTSNTVMFTSDTFNGLSGQVMAVQNNQNSTQTSSTAGGNTNYTGYGLGLNYTWQKLYVAGAYQALKSYQSAATLTSPAPALWTTAAGGTNTQDNQTYVAATYDFGILKAYAQYLNRKATDTLNPNYYASRSAQQVGVRGYFTPVVEGWASVGNGKVTTYGAGIPTANFIGYQLGSNYWLSKRTNLYAIYGQNNTSSTSVAPALTANNYAVGVRHTF